MRHALSATLVAFVTSAAIAAPTNAETAATLKKSRAQAIDYLRTTQGDDGSWTTNESPGISGLVVFSLLESGLKPSDPTVAKGLAHLESFAQPDGGVYAKGSTHRNYETCIALLAFERANRALGSNGEPSDRYDARIAAAEKFLKELQWDQGEGLEDSDTAFGGAGYGSHERPDLSNTAFLVEALKAAGVEKDDPAMQAALKFVSRTQNLETEHNQTEFAAKVNDGGFYYTPAAGGTSQAGPTDNGGLRSYGSMTYAGLKSMIYAGLAPDDPRVKAALGWIERNYTLDQNPGLGGQGQFYYYHTLAKTLDVLDKETLKDATGTEHDWRAELVAKLTELQRENGSWVNKAERWYEGDPNLATAYALMALAYCEPREQ